MNGSFKWIAGILTALLISVVSCFAGLHIDADLKQTDRINACENSVSCIKVELVNINNKLDDIIKSLK